MGETYPYEQLDGRRFQLLAQGLITAEHPNVQCFNLSGPDGGRDAVGMSLQSAKASFQDTHVFQVKFREQNPHGIPTTDDLFKWVITNLKAELPKVKRLARRGAELFTFITNVSATGHPDSGLRDRVRDWTTENLPLPTSIWWREDIDARLSRHADLVFKFSLFRGIDSVRAYFQSLTSTASTPSILSGVSAHPSNPGMSTMLLYLSKQYEEEESFRFKQVEPDPISVLDHFVDTPVIVTQRNFEFGYLHSLLTSVDPEIEIFDEDHDDAGYSVKAARLVMNEKFVEGFRRVVLEGAPGQGKTTLVQYIGQVHRARILNRNNDLQRVPTELTSAPLRLPIRIELRHLGVWLQGESPWPSPSGVPTTQPLHPSIPSFLSAHAAYATAGLELTANDVIAIMTKTPSLLMLDGLDEVPDAEVRSQVVEVAENFIKDLRAFGADIQVIVTSRPSSSTKSAVFSRQGFKYLKLANLAEEEIWEYAEDWIKRKKISAIEAVTFRKVLSGSLQKSHVAALARNPMQLAILLWLVHVKDWSLPDKRTALYDQYMSTFLDREATKDPVVRENRPILLELHGYIAWELHARSEDAKAAGSGAISKSDLKELMRSYLESQEEEDPDALIDVLFRGVQRVFALTERIQGSFEFDIQSMREYFAGTYLYKTAPHYSNAFDVAGSRPDRLEALIRNPYWLNVVRFFCGWYDKGELADLSRRLIDLCESASYRLLPHPRELVSSLLGDHVTHVSKRDTRLLAEQLTDPLSLRSVGKVLSGETVSTPIPPNEFIMPAMAAEAMRIFPHVQTDEVSYELAAILRSQISPSDRYLWWREHRPDPGSERFSAWLRSGSIAQAYCAAPIEAVPELLDLASESVESWIRCCEAGRLDVALTNPAWFEMFWQRLSAGNTVLSYPDSIEGKYIHEVWQFLASDIPFLHARRPSEATLRVPDRHPGMRDELSRLLGLFKYFPEQSLADFSSVVTFTQESRAILGPDCWTSWKTLLLVAPILTDPTGKSPAPGTSKVIFRCWRKQADIGFWRDFLNDETVALMPRAAAFVSWAPANAFHMLHAEITRIWEGLDLWQMPLIQKNISIQHTVYREIFEPCRFTNSEFQDLPDVLPGCMFPALEERFRRAYATPLKVNACRPCDTHESVDLAYRVSQLINVLGRGKANQLDADLARIRGLFPKSRSGVSDPLPRAVRSLSGPKKLPKRVIWEILENPFEFPFVLVDVAQTAATAAMVEKMPSLAAVSSRDKWCL
ncbi:NACHT domain-containing protein [Streptomyces neyagawaensis]|uniref:NACHT domain-containing protein n=1 Tax=Streptomyces neyagawaensis TaxID=42238 RepID=UPI000AA91111|nr:NACHT domain-containing protein [Streptomyces neyagawaensis]MCL6736896.1 NACHT domain-containing protein [Streptomyces neyagawaensis]MDE1687232.1 NACHT domain-containing protein [Streptomyces neyagawaensis]